MIDIDFLPDQYHQQNAYRQAKPWQIIVVISFLGLVALLAVSQNIRRRLVEKELDALTPAYELALSQTQQLSEVQAKLKQTESHAELITYLRHPWPRSQLLSALLSKLPEEITLQQLQITCEAENTGAALDRARPRPRQRRSTKIVIARRARPSDSAKPVRRQTNRCDSNRHYHR